MKKIIRSLRRFVIKHADMDNRYSVCRDAYGNIRDFCKIEKKD